LTSETASRLGDLVEIVRGTTYKSLLLDEPGPILLGLGSIAIHGGFRDEKLKTYGGESKEQHLLGPGDLFASLKSVTQDAELLGAVARVPDSVTVGRLTQDTVKLIPKSDTIDLGFIYWILRTPQYRDYCFRFATGVTTLGLQRKDFLDYTIPRRTEFRSIIHNTLEEIELLEAKLNDISTNISTIISTLFRSWFIDFDPVKAKAEGKLPNGMDEETASLFPDSFEDSELGPIPTGWKWGQLGDCISVAGGGTPSTKNEDFWDGQYNWTSPKDLSNSNSIIMLDTERTITEAGLAKVSSGLLPVDTVLMSSRAPIGYLALTKIPVAINQGYIAIPPKNNMSPNFMLSWIRYKIPLIEAYSSGSTFPEISKKEFRKLPILIPPAELIEKFNEKTTRLYDSMETSLKQMNCLKNTRDALLPRLMSGELKVPMEA
tara:strand:+ start:197 stop:1492 length:1296 start_codon:yes stop_codon:yes gene_type:complete